MIDRKGFLGRLAALPFVAKLLGDVEPVEPEVTTSLPSMTPEPITEQQVLDIADEWSLASADTLVAESVVLTSERDGDVIESGGSPFAWYGPRSVTATVECTYSAIASLNLRRRLDAGEQLTVAFRGEEAWFIGNFVVMGVKVDSMSARAEYTLGSNGEVYRTTQDPGDVDLYVITDRGPMIER